MRAGDLGSMFEPLLNLYEPDDPPDDEQTSHSKGSLADAIFEWGVFAASLPTPKQNRVLDEIRGPKNQPMLHASESLWRFKHTNREWAIWTEFAEHIKQKRRFHFGSANIVNPREWLPTILEMTCISTTPSMVFYRARNGCVKNHLGASEPFPSDKMGPPLEEKPRGRANPAGISYLYVAEEQATAVAEIRPSVGTPVSICKLTPNRTLKVADIGKAHWIDSAFDQTDLLALVQQTAFLNILGNELAHPVNPNDSELGYLPAQYLAELILDLGYDGIRYQSAVAKMGKNLVFFEPAALHINPDIRLIEINEIDVKYDPPSLW